MKNDNRQTVLDAVASLAENYRQSDIPLMQPDLRLPSRRTIIELIEEIRMVLFPGFFDNEDTSCMTAEHFAGHHLASIEEKLRVQVLLALTYHRSTEDPEAEAVRITGEFISRLPAIQEMLLKDVQAGYDGDPAAKSREEVIFSYPGFFAIYVYRIAHELYIRSVPFIPRMMTEYAHTLTGIDINSGAQIGEYFFIDHGTGVVIGETTVIGDHVKLYQGVTLGALSLRSGQKLAGKRRHPTVEDRVTIYSGASILGGETVIGEGSVIGGNTFITSSVPKNTKVSSVMPELQFRNEKK